MLCAFIPEPPSLVATEINIDILRVSWNLISANGSPITSYRIFIRQSQTADYFEETTDCLGATQGVIDQEYCDINISTLRGAPWNIDGGDSIWARVTSLNVYGESANSVDGNGAYFTRVPDAPINLAEDITVRTSSSTGLTWQDGPNNGGISITDYRISMRVQGSGSYMIIGIGVT